MARQPAWKRAMPACMDKQTQVYASEATEWLGNLHPLAEQLGSAEGLVCLASVL